MFCRFLYQTNLYTDFSPLHFKYFPSMVPKSVEMGSILESSDQDDLLKLFSTEEDCRDILNNIASNEQFERLIGTTVDEIMGDIKPESRAQTNGFKCHQCSKVFKSKKVLKKHLFIHTGIKRFCCDVCKKTFRYQSEVTAHRKSHEKPTFQCDICSAMFIHKSHLATHRRKHLNEFVEWCKECNLGFVSKSLFTKHQNLVHKNLKLMCDICGDRLSSLSSLKEHKLTHNQSYGSERSHVCEICGKSYLTLRNLREHMRTHTKLRRYVCSICGKNVSSKKVLETHIKMHTGVKDYICGVCSKGFASKEYLDMHSRTHTGNKPSICEYCGKKFTQKTSLTVHIRHHTGQKPYKCECGKVFTTKSHLMAHYKCHDIGGVDIDYISKPV